MLFTQCNDDDNICFYDECSCRGKGKISVYNLLGVNWSTVELDDKLSSNSLTDTDGEGLTDWE